MIVQLDDEGHVDVPGEGPFPRGTPLRIAPGKLHCAEPLTVATDTFSLNRLLVGLPVRQLISPNRPDDWRQSSGKCSSGVS